MNNHVDPSPFGAFNSSMFSSNRLAASYVFAIVGASLFASVSLRAEIDNKESLRKLTAAIQAEVGDQKRAENSGSGIHPDSRRMMLAQLRNAISLENPAQIEAAVGQLPVYFDSESIRKQCEELVAKLRSERQAKEKKKMAAIGVALKRAGEVVRAATAPAQLDAIRMELGAFREGRNEPLLSSSVSSDLNKVEAAIQFVTAWQDYLSDLKRGEMERARESLVNLSNLDRSASIQLIPRSEILARMTDPAGVAKPSGDWFKAETEKIVDRIHTLDDLSSAIEALGKLEIQRGYAGPRSHFEASLDSALAVFVPMDRAFREFKAGLPTNIEFLNRAAGEGDRPGLSLYINNAVPIFSELLVIVLPRYLSLPPEKKAQPAEGPYQFLDRVAAEAVAHDDFPLAARARETQRLLRDGGKAGSIGSATNLLTTAQNLEAAGQFAPAVLSYEQALASGTDLFPAKAIGERLAKIKGAHAQEFQQGLERFLSPPAPRFPEYPPGNPPGRPPGWPPGRPVPLAGQPSPPQSRQVLSVPAASASPQPTATPAVSSTPMKP